MEDVQRAVAEEGDVDVVPEGHQPQRVAKQRREEHLPADYEVIEEELERGRESVLLRCTTGVPGTDNLVPG